jgi:cytochrome c2
MGKDTGRRVVLTLPERTRVLDELNTILARTSIVAEHLEVAAARQQAVTIVWTDDQLDSILGAARSLRTAVERAPLEAD